jgi:hypothetical protein
MTMDPIRRLLLSLCAAVTGAVLLVVPVGAGAAGASEPTRIADAGWWWRAQTGLLQPLPAPGIEEGQLVVQATPDGAQAVAGVIAVLGEGQTGPVLTLDVAGEGGGAAAVVLACPTTAAWVGVHAGRWDSRPEADCGAPVAGVRSEDGGQWTFDLASLERDGRVDVVLVPGRLADAEAHPSFHLVFEAPTAGSVATVSGPAPEVEQDAAPSPSAPAPVADGPAASTFTPPAPPVVSPPVVPADAAIVPVPEVAEVAAPAGATALPPAPLTTVVDVPEPRTLARAVGAAVLLAGLAGALASRRGLLPAGTEATTASPVAGGLARFRSERTAEPQPIR